MALPKIAPYPLPAENEIPAARGPWRLDPARAALLVHDLQGYFIRAFPAGESPIAPLLANVARLKEACVSAGVPVFYTAQPGRQDRRDRGLQADLWGPGMSASLEDTKIIEEIAPSGDDIVLTKWRYSAFQRTTLGPMLHARRRDQLLITGVYAHIGCMTTAVDAFMRDVEPFFVADGVADFSREWHDLAVRWAAERCAVPLTTAAAVAAITNRQD
jgi:bifunctional isochorismate lyase/aryl carrier protein